MKENIEQPLDTRLNQHNANGKGFSNLIQKESGLTRNQARSIYVFCNFKKSPVTGEINGVPINVEVPNPANVIPRLR